MFQKESNTFLKIIIAVGFIVGAYWIGIMSGEARVCKIFKHAVVDNGSVREGIIYQFGESYIQEINEKCHW